MFLDTSNAASIGMFTSGQAFFWPGAAIPKIRSGSANFNMTEEEESWMVTAMFIGNILSPIPAGFIIDMIGRKNTLLIFDILPITSWLILYMDRTAIGVYIARALTGAWIGFVHTVVPVLIGEVVSPKIRGSMGALVGMMLYVGGMYEDVLGLYFSYDTLSLLSLLAPLSLLSFLCFIPESPYFYLMKNKRQEAESSLKWLRGRSDNDELDDIEESVKEELRNRGNFIDIINVRAYRKAFVIVETMCSVQRLAGLALLASYASVILPDSWIPANKSFTVLTGFWVMGSFLTLFIIDKFDRKELFFASSVGSGITLITVAIWYFLRDFTQADVGTVTWLPLVALCANGIFYTSAMISIPTTMQGELFPVNIKGKASAIAAVTMAIMSGVSVHLYHPITTYVGVYMNFIICAFSCFIGSIFTCTYMIETRGKSLEEIQEILTEKKRKKKKSAVSNKDNNSKTLYFSSIKLNEKK